MKKLIAFFTLLLATFLYGEVNAQASEDLTASAEVQQPITISLDNSELNFGEVFPGSSKRIDPANDGQGDSGTEGYGKFAVSGQSDADVGFTFSLPSELTDGSNNLPISYEDGDGIYYESDDPSNAGATSFDPDNGSQNTALSSSGDLYLYIGGTVDPADDQAQGSYTGTVTLEVSYN